MSPMTSRTVYLLNMLFMKSLDYSENRLLKERKYIKPLLTLTEYITMYGNDHQCKILDKLLEYYYNDNEMMEAIDNPFTGNINKLLIDLAQYEDLYSYVINCKIGIIDGLYIADTSNHDYDPKVLQTLEYLKNKNYMEPLWYDVYLNILETKNVNHNLYVKFKLLEMTDNDIVKEAIEMVYGDIEAA